MNRNIKSDQSSALHCLLLQVHHSKVSGGVKKTGITAIQTSSDHSDINALLYWALKLYIRYMKKFAVLLRCFVTGIVIEQNTFYFANGSM